MKVLIVEDNDIKQSQIISLLAKHGIKDYIVEKFASTALKRCATERFDLLITDLGIPRHVDNPVVKDEREGLRLLYDLSYEDINIPTIIFSTTKILDQQNEYLNDIEYPLLCQVGTSEELDKALENIIKSKNNITVSKTGNIVKIQIPDYMTISDYVEAVPDLDEIIKPVYSDDLLEMLCNNALWNSKKQRINKGTYYIIFHNGKLYNILINEEILKIDERIKKDNIIEERIITFDKNTSDYGYSSFKHDNRDTIFTRYYSKNGPSLGTIELSSDEAFNDLESIVSSLETIDRINDILSINLLKRYILDDFKRESFKRKKAL